MNGWLVCALLPWFALGVSEDTRTVSLSDILEGLQRYPLLMAAQTDVDWAEGEARAARGAFDPVLKSRANIDPMGYYHNQQLDTVLEAPTPFWGTTFFGGYRLGLGDFASYDQKLATRSQGEVRGGMQVPLWRNGPIDRRRANIGRAELGRAIADLSVLQQEIEIVRLATQRYWEWVAAGQRLKIIRDLLTITQVRDVQIAGRVAHGDLPAIERLENTRAMVSREAMVKSAERQLQQAAIELSLFVRDAHGQPMLLQEHQLPGALPDPHVVDVHAIQEGIALAQTKRPEAKRMALIRDQNQIELRFAKNQFAPGIDLMLGASYDLGRGDVRLGEPEMEVGVMLDVPTLFRTSRGRIASAQAGLVKAEHQTTFAQDRIAADVRDAMSAMDVASQRAVLAKRERAIAHELEIAERKRFDLGESTLLFVNLREQFAIEASLREVDALMDFHRSDASYRAALGTGHVRQ